jgi:hypothetical protein
VQLFAEQWKEKEIFVLKFLKQKKKLKFNKVDRGE